MSVDYDKGADRRYMTNPRDREATSLRRRLDREREARHRAAVALERRIFEATTRDLRTEPEREPANPHLRRYMEALAERRPRQLTAQARAAIAEEGF